jgi:hypothetical protein
VRGDRAGATAPGFAALGLAAFAAIPLLGLLIAASRDAKIDRLRAMYKTGQISHIHNSTPFSSAAKSRQRNLAEFSSRDNRRLHYHISMRYGITTWKEKESKCQI